MILVAVIIGYLLGAMPFVIPKILERRDRKFEFKAEEQQTVLQDNILDEWLNGPKKKEQEEEHEEEKVNQANIFIEYMTGKETVKGD